MKKILTSTLLLAAVFGFTATAMVTTPPVTATTSTRIETTHVTGTRTETKPKETVGTVASLSNKERARVDSACAQSALTARNQTVVAALQKYASDWIETLNLRTASQIAAYDKDGNERNKAIRAASVVTQNQQAKIQATLSATKRIATNTFRNSIRACGLDSSILEE